VGGVGSPQLDHSGGLMMERKGAAWAAVSFFGHVKTLFVFQIKCPAAARPTAFHPSLRPVPRSIPRLSHTPSWPPPDLFPKIKKQLTNTSPVSCMPVPHRGSQVAPVASGAQVAAYMR
jgi:hypothetical protein